MPVEMLSENVGYIPGGVNIGVIRVSESTCALVDTGLNDTSAKKALKAVAEDTGWTVETILSTHGHADHFGGNATVVKRTGAKVFAPDLDEAILRNPILMPSLLYAGAEPPSSLRGRFLLAKPSPVDQVIAESQLELGNVQIDVIPLPGHSPGQIGYFIEGVFFCADVVLPESVLEKYRIPYLYSVTDHLLSLTRASRVEADRVIPGHGVVLESTHGLAALNRELLEDIADHVERLCNYPQTAEDIFARLIEKFEAPVEDAASYFLLHPTVFALLTWLEEAGRVAASVRGRKMTWSAGNSQ